MKWRNGEDMNVEAAVDAVFLTSMLIIAATLIIVLMYNRELKNLGTQLPRNLPWTKATSYASLALTPVIIYLIMLVVGGDAEIVASRTVECYVFSAPAIWFLLYYLIDVRRHIGDVSRGVSGN